MDREPRLELGQLDSKSNVLPLNYSRMYLELGVGFAPTCPDSQSSGSANNPYLAYLVHMVRVELTRTKALVSKTSVATITPHVHLWRSR